MSDYIQRLTEKVINGYELQKEEAYCIAERIEKDPALLEVLMEAADLIRTRCAGNQADLCTIMNVKSGKCHEDCKFCAQSVHYNTEVERYELLDEESIITRAKEMEAAGVHRFSLVTSGGSLEDEDLATLERIYKRLSKETTLKLCASHGMLNHHAAERLHAAGVSRYHHNLETSRSQYHNICTTHAFEERVLTNKIAIDAGLEVCSGGIIGMGETIQDRIDMAFDIKDVGACSIPVNILTPIPGTPLEGVVTPEPEEILITIAIYRFIFPDKVIRYAGGRKLLGEYMEKGFLSGVNGALTGNFLTTIGTDISSDQELLKSLGFALKES